jgi:hypothetical protein
MFCIQQIDKQSFLIEAIPLDYINLIVYWSVYKHNSLS